MVTRKMRHSVLYFMAAVAVMGVCGCQKAVQGETDAVRDYFSKDIPAEIAGNAMSAYFDLSDGVVLAYKNNAGAASFLNRVVQKITAGEGCEVYSLAADTILPLQLKQTELYNKIMDPRSYDKQMAPIEKTLAKVVGEGKSSLVVTDFEEFTPDKHVQHQAFATRYFVKWLKQGNDITFFVFDFKGQKKIPYHLYFIVFDNKRHELLNTIKQTVEGVEGYQEFHLSCDAYTAQTRYPSSTKGGNYHDAEGNDVVTAVPEDGSDMAFQMLGQGLKAEYYPLGDVWANVLTNSKAMAEPGVKPKFTHLLRNLFFDFSNTDSYAISRLALKVTDVEADYNAYSLYQTALKADKEEEEFYDEDGKLRPEMDYTGNPVEVSEVSDFLELDQQLFDQTKADTNGKETEIGIRFSPNFSGEPNGVQTGDLIRVDVCIDEARPNAEANLTPLFSWGQNNNLRDAIRNTLQELNPKGTVIYTYFFREI